MARFLCVGDLHLGAGSDYGPEPGARLADQADVWRRVNELAGDYEVDAVLFAGDAFDRRRPTPAELLAFVRPVQPRPRTLAIPGNHDVEAYERPIALDLFDPYVRLSKTPELIEAAGVWIATLPWTPTSRLVASENGGDRDQLHEKAAGLLVETARGLRVRVPDGEPCVLLAHWSVGGAETPTGVPTELFREPVLEVGDLDALGFNAVVLGHIHKPQKLLATGGKQTFYVGSPMPLNFGEASCEHGVWILDIDGLTEATFVPIASRRFVTLDLALDRSPEDGPPAAWEDAELEDAIVKVRVSGPEDYVRRLDIGGLRRAIVADGAWKVYSVQVDVERADRPTLEGVDETLTELEALDRYLEARGIDGPLADAMRERTARYLAESANG